MHRTEGANCTIDNKFTEGPPASTISAAWLNAVQEELCYIIEQAGIMLKSQGTDTRTQVWDALQTLFIPVGTITMYGAASPPYAYLNCDGSSLLRADYPALFTVIGTTFGAVDGTHFSLPDMRGIFPIGAGTTDRMLGKTSNGSFFSATLGQYLTDSIQGHYHNKSPDPAYIFDGTGNIYGPSITGYSFNFNDVNITNMKTDGVNGNTRDGNVTQGPSLGLNFIIKYR